MLPSPPLFFPSFLFPHSPLCLFPLPLLADSDACPGGASASAGGVSLSAKLSPGFIFGHSALALFPHLPPSSDPPWLRAQASSSSPLSSRGSQALTPGSPPLDLAGGQPCIVCSPSVLVSLLAPLAIASARVSCLGGLALVTYSDAGTGVLGGGCGWGLVPGS